MTSVPDVLPTIVSDATLLSVILSSLIDSALSYRRAGTDHSVAMHCTRTDTTVTRQITGAG